MKPASAPRMLVLRLLVLPLIGGAVPVSGQDSCPRASGPDAEAGWTAYSAGDLAEARARFDAALARCPDDRYAETGLGYVELREGNVDAATTLWSRVVAQQPNDVDALTGLGLAAWRTGDVEAVRERFTRVLTLVPDHATALEYLDRVEGARSRTEQDAADRAWLRGDTELAFDLYSARLEEDPQDDLAALRVGLVRAWSGDYDAALGLLNRIVERDPTNVDARLARARVWAWSGDLARARREAEAVLATQPDNPEALEALAQFQAWSGDVDEALASYDQLTAIAPQNGAVGRGRAQALAWAERYEASRAAYDSLLARDPDDVEARLGLARTLAYQQDFPAAIEQYDRILQDRPDEVRAWIGLARTLGWAGRLAAGEEVAAKAVDIDRSHADAWAALGQLYVWEGRTAAALEAFETAADLAPTNAPVQDRLRAVRLALAPNAGPTVVYESDSDDNRMITTSLSAGWHPVPRLDVRLNGFYKDLQQGIFSRAAQGGTLSARYQVRPGWLFTGALGGVHSNSTRRSSLTELRAGVRTPERHPLVASVDASSVPLTETARLAELGGRSTDVVVSARWSPSGVWRLDGSVGIGRYEGTEDNGRRSAALAGSYRLGRFFSVGAAMRTFSFEKDLNDGYFDPDFYGIAELTGYWLYRPLPWSFLVELAPGIQQVRSDGDRGATLRSNARIAYELGPGRDLSLSFGYSSAGLVSFATGESDYRYTALVLGSSWAF